MKTKINKKFIISLISDDLIHNKLVTGLMSLDLNAGQYSTNIGDKVISLMGFNNPKQNELIYEHYISLLERGKHVSLKENLTDIQKLAKEIYEELLQQKPVI